MIRQNPTYLGMSGIPAALENICGAKVTNLPTTVRALCLTESDKSHIFEQSTNHNNDPRASLSTPAIEEPLLLAVLCHLMCITLLGTAKTCYTVRSVFPPKFVAI